MLNARCVRRRRVQETAGMDVLTAASRQAGVGLKVEMSAGERV
jgi:hypothetical protein